MSAIVIVDTSVFWHIVEIPDSDAETREAVLAEFARQAKDGGIFLLPIATIIETGNRIAQRGNGHERRETADRYAREVRRAIDGCSPFRPTRLFELDELGAWLDEFPDHAMRGGGMGDLSLIEEWERQRTLNPKRRVRIWTLDEDLFGYDTHPE